MKLRHFLAALALLIPTASVASEISETLAKPIRATMTSPKKPVDLEFCVADAITQIGGAVPVPIRKGERDVLMLGYGHTPKLIVSLINVETGTRIEVRTKGSDMDDKLIGHLKASCELPE